MPPFIVVEGPDGTGKTTLADALADTFRAQGRDVWRVRDPGGTSIGDSARAALLHGGDVAPVAELFLFLAARAQLAHEVIRPKLASGATVIADRFWLSTLAYQGALPDIAALFPGDALRDLVIPAAGAEPTHWILLDAPVEVGLARVGHTPDRLERRAPDYFRAVRARYREESARITGAHVARIDAALPKDAVLEAATAFLRPNQQSTFF